MSGSLHALRRSIMAPTRRVFFIGLATCLVSVLLIAYFIFAVGWYVTIPIRALVRTIGRWTWIRRAGQIFYRMRVIRSQQVLNASAMEVPAKTHTNGTPS